ncbi:MAG: YlxR family protein [Ruminococcaceae bacterium]|nr:YlxR family protein [Oscillospiraceae bacterium]
MKPKKIPLRMCLGCNEMKPKQELLRVVKSPENEVSLDLIGKKNGRGAYICHSTECLERAVKSKRLERTFQTAIPNEVYESLKKELDSLG